MAQARIRFVVGDPSSYLYLDSRRPAQECLTLANTGTGHSCKSFSPSNATHLKECAGYNDYKYGLDLDDLAANAYVKPFKESQDELDKLKSAFPRQDLRFMLGDQDYCNCNTENFENGKHCYPLLNPPDRIPLLKNHTHADAAHTHAPTFPRPLVCLPDKYGGHGCCDTWPDATDHNAMDTKCGGMVQGTNRLQRGLNFMDYLKDYYSGHSYFNYDFFTGGHDFPSMVQHPTFKRWAFKKKD